MIRIATTPSVKAFMRSGFTNGTMPAVSGAPLEPGLPRVSCDDLVKARAMAALRLMPQKREFFALFVQASANAREIARLLVELLDDWPAGPERLHAIREAEHEGDRLTREVINLLNRTFVTPLDRDDMYRLVTVIDDVCDYIDEAADNIDAYEVQEIPAKAREQADVIYRAASRLHEAVELLEGFKDSHRAALRPARAGGRGRPAAARGDRRAVPQRAGPAGDHPLEGHSSTARGRCRCVRERGRRARGDSRQEPVTLLVITVVVALVFDFTNGFHDTANSVATSISTRALSPRLAVLIAAIANLAGAFATTAVAKTVGKGIIDSGLANEKTVLAAVLGAIVWNLLTWWLGLPSSSSHALIGGLVGAALVQSGIEGRRVARDRPQGRDPGRLGADARVRRRVCAPARDLLGRSSG